MIQGFSANLPLIGDFIVNAWTSDGYQGSATGFVNLAITDAYVPILLTYPGYIFVDKRLLATLKIKGVVSIYIVRYTPTTISPRIKKVINVPYAP